MDASLDGATKKLSVVLSMEATELLRHLDAEQQLLFVVPEPRYTQVPFASLVDDEERDFLQKNAIGRRLLARLVSKEEGGVVLYPITKVEEQT